jgi:hypothetical protein
MGNPDRPGYNPEENDPFTRDAEMWKTLFPEIAGTLGLDINVDTLDKAEIQRIGLSIIRQLEAKGAKKDEIIETIKRFPKLSPEEQEKLRILNPNITKDIETLLRLFERHGEL